MDTKQLLPRGVYEMPMLSPNGSCCAVAINTQGAFIAWMWYEKPAEQATARALWKMLNERDPLPFLKAI